MHFNTIRLIPFLTFLCCLTANAQSFIGYMSYSDTWSDGSGVHPHCGWYTFELSSPSFQRHTDDDYVIKACKGGTCAEGRLYAMESATDSWLFPDPQLHIYDASTYKLEKTVSYGRSDRDHATKDFAINPADHKLYAIAQYRDGNTADGGWLQHYDLTTGEMTRIAHLPVYQHALAIDGEGQFFTLSEDGCLNRITWNESKKRTFADYGAYPEATIERIGQTGYRLQGDITYANSLCFDYRSGRLFWAASVYPAGNYEGTDALIRGIFEVSLTDGKATLLQQFPDNTIITALAVPYLGLDHPDDIQDLNVTPSQPGSEYVSIAFTAPAVTYGQQPYAEGSMLRVHPLIDGRDYYATMLEAGYIGEDDSFVLSEADFHVTPGERWGEKQVFRLSTDAYHTLGAFVEDLATGAVSQKSEKTLWVGFDMPTRPADARLTFSRDRSEATITWSPVTIGEHGGDIDLASLRYIVTRRADNGTAEEDVAFGITDCSFTDRLDCPMSYTRYEVYALTDQNLSEPARTPYAVIGQPRELPFYSTFSYVGEFHQFIVIDANGDGWDDWETPSWYFDSTYGAAFCYLNRLGEAQDDWLITPALQLEAGADYEVIFQSYGYYGNVPIHLQVAVGEYAEAESLSRIIYDNKYAVAMPSSFPFEQDDVLTALVPFTAQEGERHIGFHNITTTFDHMSLDNIYIRTAEGQGVLAPEIIDQQTIRFALSGRKLYHSTPSITIGRDGKKRVL